MRMRVRAGRYSTGNSAGGKIFGIFLIMFGLMFALSSISMSCRTSMIKKMIPGDAKEYDAYITEVLSVKSDVVWNFSDIANALMAIPNLICLLALSGEIARDMKEFQEILKKERAAK